MADEQTTAADSGDASDAPQEARPASVPAGQVAETNPATPSTTGDLSNGARIIEETVVAPAPPPRDIVPPRAVDAPLPPLPSLAPLEPSVGAPSVAAPPSPPQPQPPTAAAMPAPHSAEGFAKEKEIIEDILREAKLPEQRVDRKPQTPRTVFDTLLGTSPPPVQVLPPTAVADIATAPAKTGAPNAASKTGELAETIVSPLRTLKNDLQSIVRLKKMSLVRAVTLEQEKLRHPSEEERENEEVHVQRSHRTMRILSTAALFFLLGATAFFGVFIVMEERSGTSIEAPQSFILFAENGVPFPLEGSALELKRLLGNARLSGNGTLGSITRIVPTSPETNAKGSTEERPATLEEFLRALGTRVPDELLRALSQDFFFGLHTVDENAPFFVIPVVSYERAFAGMLTWEETLNADLSPIFTPLLDQVIGSGGLPEKRRFDDVVMRNYDVRILKDDAGTIELYYSFPTRALLVIAESPYSFTEILSRLRAERKL